MKLLAALSDRQRQMILARELPDTIIAARLGACPRSIRRLREKLTPTENTAA